MTADRQMCLGDGDFRIFSVFFPVYERKSPCYG
jgi:hypothetical protein